MNTTSLTLGNMIAAIVQWVILLFLLRKFVFKPIMSAMNTRQEKIANQIREAERLKAEAEKLKSEQDKLINQAKDEAKAIMAAARREGDEQARAIIETAQREASWRQKAALEEIDREKAEAVKEIRGHVADLVVAATQKLLERNLDPSDQRHYVEEFIQQAGSPQ